MYICVCVCVYIYIYVGSTGAISPANICPEGLDPRVNYGLEFIKVPEIKFKETYKEAKETYNLNYGLEVIKVPEIKF